MATTMTMRSNRGWQRRYHTFFISTVCGVYIKGIVRHWLSTILGMVVPAVVVAVAVGSAVWAHSMRSSMISSLLLVDGAPWHFSRCCLSWADNLNRLLHVGQIFRLAACTRWCIFKLNGHLQRLPQVSQT